MVDTQVQSCLWDGMIYPDRIRLYPRLRYMGSKYRLLPWIHSVLSQLTFTSALDAFSGSGCVAYLLKAMGKRVIANDFLAFAHHIASASIENDRHRLSAKDCDSLLQYNPRRKHFIEKTFTGIFFSPSDLRFLDNLWANLPCLRTKYHRSLALAAAVRACIKRQPRGVFTVAGDPEHYKDGRRDLRLTLQEHFLESVDAYNDTVFDNGQQSKATCTDVFDLDTAEVDLVYMDPPYVPRSDDNCYIKRYHFLEGLATYWTDTQGPILYSTKVRKIPKRFTPFSYRRFSVEAFDRMLSRFRDSILVLSYSSSGYPNLDVLLTLMRKYKTNVEVLERKHRYHFGTHDRVSSDRTTVSEYLVIGL